jgi:hypothetical protein
MLVCRSKTVLHIQPRRHPDGKARDTRRTKFRAINATPSEKHRPMMHQTGPPNHCSEFFMKIITGAGGY